MQILSRLSERQAHGLRWLLLLGWLGLIGSLLLSPWVNSDLISGRLTSCAPVGNCNLHQHDGNRLFWGVVVPLGLLMIVAMSHELWRRLCPLAFVSQLFRALGWQRTGMGPGGRVDVIRVTPHSWLGRHNVELQWTLFIAGLSLRLLVVNSSPFGLGFFLLLTVLAAVIIGWAYGGKAWCQYVCPMGPVQTILIGPRSLLGSPAHLGSGPKLSQSMCRTSSTHGGEKSTCVACQSPCIDIDSERSYWQTLTGKRGLTFAWYSYPGIILAFFLILQLLGGADHDYLHSGRWAYDNTIPPRIWAPLSNNQIPPMSPSSKLRQPPTSKPATQPDLPAKGSSNQWSREPMESAAPSPSNSYGHWRSDDKAPSLLEENNEHEPGPKDEAESIKELLKEAGQQPQEQSADSSGGSHKPGS